MAGKIQFAAKCLLGTTLLASGSGGVYYATTHGWSLPAASQTAKQPTGELDAIAGAWAEPAAKHPQGTADSSPVARSADATQSHETKPTPKVAGLDRYATMTKPITPLIAVREDKLGD